MEGEEAEAYSSSCAHRPACMDRPVRSSPGRSIPCTARRRLRILHHFTSGTGEHCEGRSQVARALRESSSSGPTCSSLTSH